MKYFVELLGDASDLEDLSKVYSLPELTICKEDDMGFVLKSTDFDGLENAIEIDKKASEIVELINGASKIALGSNKVLAVGVTIGVDDQGVKQRHNIGRGHMILPKLKINMTIKKQDGTVYEINQAALMVGWYRIAKKDKTAEKVLRQLAKNDLDWNKLNIVLEDIQGNVGSGIYEWVEDKEVVRFTQTVQDKRHGESGLKKHKWQPHKNPMNFDEARSFILHIVENWLNSRIVGQVPVHKASDN